RGGREVGAADPIALRRQNLGDAAHAGAADADEVHALDLVLHRAPAARQASAMRTAASWRPTARAATASASARSRVRPATRSASVAASSRSCLMQVAPPA